MHAAVTHCLKANTRFPGKEWSRQLQNSPHMSGQSRFCLPDCCCSTFIDSSPEFDQFLSQLFKLHALFVERCITVQGRAMHGGQGRRWGLRHGAEGLRALRGGLLCGGHGEALGGHASNVRCNACDCCLVRGGQVGFTLWPIQLHIRMRFVDTYISAMFT